jgi:dimethylargininase
MCLIAITREVSPSINDCELTFHGRQSIDVNRAIQEHRAYQDCLAALGARIVSLPAEPNLPDAVFVEDTAVVLEGIAVVANMGAASRRPETRSIAEVLARHRPVRFLPGPATVDGGDVLAVAPKIFVGLSRRTNGQGIEQLRRILGPHGYEVQGVEVTGCLHLKSACSYLGRNIMIVNRSWNDSTRLHGFAARCPARRTRRRQRPLSQ